MGDRMSSNALKRQIEGNQRRLQESCDSNDLDCDTERFLEDERYVSSSGVLFYELNFSG